MEDLQNTDPLYYEHIMIQNELHKLISLINEAKISEKQKLKLREKTYLDFLEKVRDYKSCPGFKNMNVEELKHEYEKFIKSLNHREER